MGKQKDVIIIHYANFHFRMYGIGHRGFTKINKDLKNAIPSNAY